MPRHVTTKIYVIKSLLSEVDSLLPNAGNYMASHSRRQKSP